MKKLLGILCFCLFFVSCEDNLSAEKIDDALIEQSIVHQEEIDQFKDEILALEDEIASLKTGEGSVDNPMTLEEAVEALKIKEEEVLALEREKKTWSEGNNGTNDLNNLNIKILSGNKNSFSYVFDNMEEAYAQRTYVLGQGEFLDLMHDDEERDSLHVGEGLEVSAFEIYGTVYNFTWADITWNDDFSSYEVSEVLHTISKVTDTTVYVHAMLAETLPYQVVSFENEAGETITQTLSYDGFGFNGKVLSFKD